MGWKNCPANNGTQVMNGTLVVKSSAIEADFSSIIHDGYQGFRFRVTASTTLSPAAFCLN